MKTIIYILIFLIFPVLAGVAQHIGPMTWATENDFKQDEKYIVEDILWLEDHPLASETNDTKALSEYVLNWLSNTPYISVTLDQIFLDGVINKKYKYAEKFRVTYLFGKSVYQIQHPGETDDTMASGRGVEAMAKVYMDIKKVDPSVKNRMLEKYSKLYRSGKLDGYVSKTISNNKGSAVN